MYATNGLRADRPEEDRVPVELFCIICSRVEVIHVPRHESPRGRIRWECLQCQETVSRPPIPR